MIVELEAEIKVAPWTPDEMKIGVDRHYELMLSIAISLKRIADALSVELHNFQAQLDALRTDG